MSDTTAVLRLNSDARMELRRVGREGHPLLIIDDVLAEPEALVAAALLADFTPPPHTRYPGLNAPLPAYYANGILAAVNPLLARAFGMPAHLPKTLFGFFALATQAPEELEPIQKVPHHDSPDPFRIAMVHYLCRDMAGGTAFFRHKATGFEGVDGRRRAAYVEQAAVELEASGADLTRHVNDETPNFEQIDFAPLKFNRLIIYRSHVLHSGLLEGANLSADPAVGRLTANSFVDIQKPTQSPS
ncbi:DUF6445 family protein [Asticcacaulis sp. 201]|uniref:DUF6445 family protein n=1 Tax=Asticcacaulis sp. 201 TaxID=3028787 RepID=UPI00291650A1|nr:DUF6445 family protein [Asticcacaulis sp. 201]MDV6331597.1 DUF6445 family protein [Asticcacaulis sp. 201]